MEIAFKKEGRRSVNVFQSSYLQRIVDADQIILRPTINSVFPAIGSTSYQCVYLRDGREELHLLVIGKSPTEGRFGIFQSNEAILKHENLWSGNNDLRLIAGVEMIYEIPSTFQVSLNRQGDQIGGLAFLGNNGEHILYCNTRTSSSPLCLEINQNSNCIVSINKVLGFDEEMIPKVLVDIVTLL